MNTPFNIREHWAALKEVAPGLRREVPDLFGTENQMWQRVYMPKRQAEAFDKQTKSLGLHSDTDLAHSHEACRVLCKYEREMA